MTIQIGLLMLIILTVVVLFSIDQFRADVIAIGLLVTLSLTGLIPRGETFAGFGSDTAVMIFGLLVLTAAVTRTGVIDLAGRRLLRLLDNRRQHLLLVVTAIVTLLSGFVSNTATAALFLPIVLELSRRTRTPRARLLMPLAFAAILGSSLSLVASSTNVLVSGLMVDYGMEPLRMFELTLVGLPISLVGLLYMHFVGNRLIPVRGDATDEATLSIRPYLTEAVVVPGSPLIGKTLAESGLGRDLDLTVVRILRDKNRYVVPTPHHQLQVGDELLVKGDRSDVLRIKSLTGLELKAEVKLSDPRLQTDDACLAEIVVLPGSPVSGRTLKTLQFRQQYGLQVLGMHRRDKDLFSKLSQVRFRPGDELLVQGARATIGALDPSHFYTLGMIERSGPNQRRAPISIAIFLGAVLLATLEIVSLPIAVTLGVLGVFLTRCITPDEAYHQVQWQALIVVGCMLALGTAMEYTGTARFIAEQVIRLEGLSQPTVLLSLFFFLTMLLTQPMSNQAAAVLVLPIAVQTATHLGLNPRAFAVMIAVSASCSFITPLEPACLIVYGPGHYKFLDFTKVGSLLTVILYLVSIVLVPLFWPLTG